MAGITETKQFKITPDGKIELVVTDEVELLALATRYLFPVRDDKETRTCREIPAFAEILNADMAFLIYDTKPAKKMLSQMHCSWLSIHRILLNRCIRWCQIYVEM